MFNTMNKMIKNTAKNVIKQKYVVMGKEYITKQMKCIIGNLRKERKEIKSIFNRIRNIKKQTNGKINEEILKDELIQNFGKDRYQKYLQWKIKNKLKIKMIRILKRKYEKDKAAKLINNNKGKEYYKIFEELENH